MSKDATFDRHSPINRIFEQLAIHYFNFDSVTFWNLASIIGRLMNEDHIIGWVMCDDFIASWLEANADRIENACRSVDTMLKNSIINMKDYSVCQADEKEESDEEEPDH